MKYIGTKTVYSWIFGNLNLFILGYFCMYLRKESVQILYLLKFSLIVNNALSIKFFTDTILPLMYILPENFQFTSANSLMTTFN